MWEEVWRALSASGSVPADVVHFGVRQNALYSNQKWNDGLDARPGAECKLSGHVYITGHVSEPQTEAALPLWRVV